MSRLIYLQRDAVLHNHQRKADFLFDGHSSFYEKWYYFCILYPAGLLLVSRGKFHMVDREFDQVLAPKKSKIHGLQSSSIRENPIVSLMQGALPRWPKDDFEFLLISSRGEEKLQSSLSLSGSFKSPELKTTFSLRSFFLLPSTPREVQLIHLINI